MFFYQNGDHSEGGWIANKAFALDGWPFMIPVMEFIQGAAVEI